VKKEEQGGPPVKSNEKIIEFIKNQKTAFIASVDEEGFPNMKAMFMPRKIEANCYYFTTNTSSLRAQQYLKNSQASIYFYNKGRFRYEGVMLIGTMEVLLDDAIKKEIWRTGDTMYYRKGASDPDYCVLKFTAIKGRHYSDLKTESFDIDSL
jgi:general stress protein 26